MCRLRREDGAGLIMVIGMAAVLAVLAATLVLVTANDSGFTSNVREKTQTFNVAEAGIDDAVYSMGQTWPSTPGAVAMDYGAFRDGFASGEFPDPPAGKDFLTVTLTPPTDDPTGANSWWIESQANVGSKSTRIRTLVVRQTVGLSTLVPGMAVYAGGDLSLTGNSNFSKGNSPSNVSVQVYGSAGGNGNLSNSTAPFLIRGDWDYHGNWDEHYVSTGQTIPTFDQVMPPTAIQSLVTAAKATPSTGTLTPSGGGNLTITGNNNITYSSPIRVNGNLALNGNCKLTCPGIYVTGNVTGSGNMNLDVGGMFVGGSWNTTGNLTFTNLGPTFVSGNVSMRGNGSWKMPLLVSDGSISLSGNADIGGNGIGGGRPPAIVLTKQNMHWNGNGNFTGLFCTQGDFDGNGNGRIYGQIISRGDVTPTGSFNVTYDTNVNSNLRTDAATIAKLAPNSWQEIEPL